MNATIVILSQMKVRQNIMSVDKTRVIFGNGSIIRLRNGSIDSDLPYKLAIGKNIEIELDIDVYDELEHFFLLNREKRLEQQKAEKIEEP
jgi:hypothetical protein